MRTVTLLLAAATTCSAAPLKTKVLFGNDHESEPTTLANKGRFSSPFGLAFSEKGVGYVVELGGGRVWELFGSSGLSPRCIAGQFGKKSYRGDGELGFDATFNGMHNVAITTEGNLLISDTWNHCVRQIDAKAETVSTFAGNGEPGFAGDGSGTGEARFHDVICVSLDPEKKTLYIADIKNRRIRAVDMKTKIVRTVAGNGKRGVPVDGAVATAAPLVDPRAVAADAAGNVWILERGGHALRLVTPDGKIQTVAGTGKKGSKDGAALEAQFAGPKHLCFDGAGRVIIADEQNAAIRAYDPKAKTLTTILGRGVGDPARTLSRPHGVTFHDGKLYIVDTGHNRILVER